MKNIIFFTPIPETGKLSTVIMDNSVDELKSAGVIPLNSKTVVKTYSTDDLDLMALVYHIELHSFNSNENPSDIILNKSIAEIAILEDIRAKRSELFADLDSLQTRALLANKSEVVSEIEADKTKLRNITLSVDLTNKNTLREIWKTAPIELFIDYKAKYESKLK